MSTLYLIALCGVCVIMLGVMFDAMARVSRKPEWKVPAYLPAIASQERPPLEAIVVAAVEERHSGFAGLTNSEEFKLTA